MPLKGYDKKFGRLWSKYKNKGVGRYTFVRRLGAVSKFTTNQGKILDVGAGDCQLIFELTKNNKATGFALDIFKRLMIDSRKKYGGGKLKYLVGCGEKIPLKEGIFDNVVCTVTIEHFFCRKSAVSEMSRVLKKGGKLIITGVNPFFYFLEKMTGITYKILNKPYLPVVFTTKEHILKDLRDNNISIEYVDGFTALPFNLKFIEKMENKIPKFLRLNLFLNFVIVGVKKP